ncbi:MAG: hypothetical protein Q8O89_05050 [Nanoarchaeota archaeon]|nr:hypothetical protein [Nanoarchaeota archaeon]
MSKKLVLWPYLPGQKRLIIDDVMSNGRQVVFFNGSTKEFEFIDNDMRQIISSIDEFENIAKNDELNVLYSGNMIKDLTSMLKKRNLAFIEKKEIYA